MTPQTIAAMNAFADEIGAHFAKEPDPEKMLVWMASARNEIIDDCCSSVTRMRDVITECNAIDSMLGRIERKREEFRLNMPREEIMQEAANEIALSWMTSERHFKTDELDADTLYVLATNVLARYYAFKFDQGERHQIISALAPASMTKLRNKIEKAERMAREKADKGSQ